MLTLGSTLVVPHLRLTRAPAMAPLPPNLYSQVIEWVMQQQQLALAGQSSTMTAPQRKALIELHQLVKPTEVDPPLEAGTEWISHLNRRFLLSLAASKKRG